MVPNASDAIVAMEQITKTVTKTDFSCDFYAEMKTNFAAFLCSTPGIESLFARGSRVVSNQSTYPVPAPVPPAAAPMQGQPSTQSAPSSCHLHVAGATCPQRGRVCTNAVTGCFKWADGDC